MARPSHHFRRITRRRVLGGLAALPAVAATRGLAQADPALLSYPGSDRAERLLAAARKEGTFTWYTSFAEKDVPAVVEPFEKKYGIKVGVWRASTEKVLQRTLTETAARRYDVDLVHISAPEMEALAREKVLQPVASPLFAQLLPGSVPAHRQWASTLLTVWGQAYNTNALRKDEVPRSYRDLLDPRFKGKLGAEVEDQEWFATVVLSMGEPQGLQFFRELVAKNGVSARKGHTLLTNLVVSGEVPLGLTVYYYMAEQAKRKGAPIDWIALDAAVARPNGQGIARRRRIRTPRSFSMTIFSVTRSRCSSAWTTCRRMRRRRRRSRACPSGPSTPRRCWASSTSGTSSIRTS